jgi:hypothetical protein
VDGAPDVDALVAGRQDDEVVIAFLVSLFAPAALLRLDEVVDDLVAGEEVFGAGRA